MTSGCQNRKSGAVRFYLLASLLLHGLLILTAIWMLPSIIQKQPESPELIMTSLTSPLSKNTDGKVVVHTPQPVSPVSAIPPAAQQPAPFQTRAPAPGNLLTLKRSDASKGAQDTTVIVAKQNQSDNVLHQITRGQATTAPSQKETTGGTSQPQELPFGSASAPAFIKQVAPVYPALARRRGKGGTVLLRLHISKTGQLLKTEVLEDPGYGFAEAALEAVQTSSFSPGRHNGKPITMKATLPIRFALHE
jgi:protein TonB